MASIQFFHAVSDNLYGPFVVKDTIGKGHNPEVFRLSDGQICHLCNQWILYIR